jgi:hypothetical protein
LETSQGGAGERENGTGARVYSYFIGVVSGVGPILEKALKKMNERMNRNLSNIEQIP